MDIPWDTYANLDKKVKTEGINQTKDWSPDQGKMTKDKVFPMSTSEPGSGSSWRRPFLLATVCLGLLYVLMLIGFIILSVYYSGTQNKVEDLETYKAASGSMVQYLMDQDVVNKNNVAALKNTVKNLTDELTRSEIKVAALGNILPKSQVAFAASLGNVGLIGMFDGTVTLKYQHVTSNIGGGYNPTTGIFTAPVRGVYFFMITGITYYTRFMLLMMMKNGDHVIATYQNPAANSWQTATNSVSLTLEIGDQVYIQLYPYTSVYDDPFGYTTFNGQLLFPLI